MQVVVKPSSVSGTITAPASKSAMQRACAAALVKGGITVLNNPGISADDKAALEIIQKLGATVEHTGEKIIIKSHGVQPVFNEIDCGESGLSVRMFTSIAALSNKSMTITGKGSLQKRPVNFFDEVLPQLGAVCNSSNGFLPLKIKGPIQPQSVQVDGSLSSQFLTGLLFAYAGANAADVSILVKNLNSKPYIDLTLQVMADFGLKTPVNRNYEEFYFPQQSISQFAHKQISYTVEGDWSGGAFLLVAGAIAGEVSVQGLNIFSSQADKKILDALEQTGAVMNFSDDVITIFKSALKAFEFDATDCPDLFPPLVALAAYCNGTSFIKGVHRLTHKESNRALTLQEEFGKMGVSVQLQNDQMIISGGKKITAATLHSHNDHRIAMACAVAALGVEGEIVIDGAEAVHKSYPQFWEHLQYLQKEK